MKSRKWLMFLVALLLILSGCTRADQQEIKHKVLESSNSPEVKLIKSMTTDEGIPLGELIDAGLSSPTFELYDPAEDGNTYITISGNIMYRGTEAVMVMQYKKLSAEAYEFYTITINDIPIDANEIAEAFEYLKDSYYKKQAEGEKEPTDVSVESQNDADSEENLENSSEEALKKDSQTSITQNDHGEDIFGSLSFDDKKALNIFFSNFSEANFGDFDINGYDEDALINFAIKHNRINYRKRIQLNGNREELDGSYVSQTIDRFFDLSIDNRSISGYEYRNGNYIWAAADGEQFWEFTQVDNLYDNMDGTFSARLSVYSAGFEYEGMKKIYEPKNNSWDSSFTPDYIGIAEAIIKKTDVNGRNTYQLIKYERKY